MPLVTDNRRVLTACPGVAVSLDAFGGSEPEGADPEAPDEAGR